MKRFAQLALVVPAFLISTVAHSDTQCLSSDLSTRAVGADWSIPAAACISSDTPVSPAPAPRPMVVTREKMMATGNAPVRSPSHRHPAGGDPVLGDGEFFEQRVDATLGGQGPRYMFKRTYRSRVTFRGGLGHAWDHSYDKRILGVHKSDKTHEWIEPACDNSFDFQDGELNIMHFVRDAAATATHPLWRARGTGLTLDVYPGAPTGVIQWQIHDADGNTMVFDPAGFLASISDAAGNALTFDWGPSPLDAPDLGLYGWPKQLLRVRDGVRTVNYVYTATGNLQCISLGTQCGDETSRPADVLAYVSYTPNQELSVVYHGQATVGERMVYRSSGPMSILNYFPSDCLPSPMLPQYCNRFCGAVDAKDASTCHNLDAGTPFWNYCSQVWCKLRDGASSASNPDQILCQRKYGAAPDPLCMQAYAQSPDCVNGCMTAHQCKMSWGVPVQAFYSFGGYDDLAHNITDIYDEQGNRIVHNDYGETPWDVSFDRVQLQTLAGVADDTNTISFQYHDLDVEAGNALVYLPARTQRHPGPYSTPDPTNVVAAAQYVEGTLCPRASCVTAPDGTCSIWSYNAPVTSNAQGTQPTIPKNAVVITDVHGIKRTQYYDANYNLIREVNVSAGETRDFNYSVDGYLTGVREASGVRACYERDSDGRTLQSTSLPAAGYGGLTTPRPVGVRHDRRQRSRRGILVLRVR